MLLVVGSPTDDQLAELKQNVDGSLGDIASDRTIVKDYQECMNVLLLNSSRIFTTLLSEKEI